MSMRGSSRSFGIARSRCVIDWSSEASSTMTNSMREAVVRARAIERMVGAIRAPSLRAGIKMLTSGRVDTQCPFPQQLDIPAMAVIDVMAVVAVVATTATMPMIAVQHPQPQPPVWGTPPGVTVLGGGTGGGTGGCGG